MNKIFPFFLGFQYNISFGDVLWNPLAVKAELESRFGFDGPHVEKLLSYTAQLTEVNNLKISVSNSIIFFFICTLNVFSSFTETYLFEEATRLLNILASFPSNK